MRSWDTRKNTLGAFPPTPEERQESEAPVEDEGPHEEEEGGAWRQLRERPPRPPTSIPWGVTAAAAAALGGGWRVRQTAWCWVRVSVSRVLRRCSTHSMSVCSRCNTTISCALTSSATLRPPRPPPPPPPPSPPPPEPPPPHRP